MTPVAVPNPPLRDDVLVLRPWTDADAPSLRPACGDEAICSHSTVPWRYTLADARAWVERQENKRQTGGGITLAIVPAGARAPVGTVVLSALDAGERTARVGYWLVAAARGHGYAARAARLLVDWSARELALRRIELVVLPANTASRRVAIALGAVDLGLRPDLATSGERRDDAHLYRIDL